MHLSLRKDAPEPRQAQTVGRGLHHQYIRIWFPTRTTFVADLFRSRRALMLGHIPEGMSAKYAIRQISYRAVRFAGISGKCPPECSNIWARTLP
jgi:hypothetical protein